MRQIARHAQTYMHINRQTDRQTDRQSATSAHVPRPSLTGNYGQGSTPPPQIYTLPSPSAQNPT